MEALFHKLEGLMPGDFLVLAGAVPSQMPGSIYEQICAKLQNKGVHIVVDTTGDALLAVLDYHPFLIKPITTSWARSLARTFARTMKRRFASLQPSCKRKAHAMCW